MDDDFLCQYDGHDEDEILGFCLNSKCKENSQFCLKCCWDKHSSHEEECKTFKQIQKTIASNKVLEEKQKEQLVNKIKEIQNLCDQITHQKNVDAVNLQALEKDLKDKEYKKCLDHIPLFKQYCQYLQSNSQQVLLDQLDQGLKSLKLFTLGISAILEQTKILDNQSISIKSEIINPNQNEKKPAQVEIQKKDQEVQVNIELPAQTQKKNEIEIVENKDYGKPVGQTASSRVGLPPQSQQPPSTYNYQQPSSAQGYQQPKPQNPSAGQNSSSNIYPPQGSNPPKTYPQPNQYQQQNQYQQSNQYQYQQQNQYQPQNPTNKSYQPPTGSSSINSQPYQPSSGSSSINQQPYSQQSGKVPPPQTKPYQPSSTNPQNQQYKPPNPNPNQTGQKTYPPPGTQSQIQKYQPQNSEQGNQKMDPQQLMSLLGSSGNEGLMKQVIEYALQQEVNKNSKNGNQPAPKVQLDMEQVKYYQSQIEAEQVIKQCAELLQQDKYKETLDIINKANIGIVVDNVQILQIKWKCLLKTNQLEDALQICNQIIELNQDDTKFLAIKGLTLHQLNRYEEAMELFDIATEINPNEFNGYFHKGQTLLSLKKYEEAIKCFERAIEIDPESEPSYFLLGNALKKLEKFNQAVENYNITVNINPQHQVALTFKAQCLIELKVYEEAIKAADAALSINENNSLALYSKGLGLFKVEAFKEALSCLEKAILIDNTMHEAIALRGEILHKMEKYVAAVSAYDLALQISANPQYMLKKAESLRALEKVEEADILQNQAQQLIDQQKQPQEKQTI
ncbi:unnamed protein product (macronuclear) [Paramecium tetraurelia]|uniref:Uncharacterized protein n=1 Tax=Paramecium tetraurelia TaxID=5888 RepID=A0C306_PARTE|nr:uncharacterized protein GSPATT00034651001 [Paramecium tetraurelia]CAK65173.1 unnamed protein product [Paramecium tetraurelia]|eukprot:XP_001432570.1 hypothetical protein (macronuclear) [Paramecium tetraurelia strain d4-2]